MLCVVYLEGGNEPEDMPRGAGIRRGVIEALLDVSLLVLGFCLGYLGRGHHRRGRLEFASRRRSHPCGEEWPSDSDFLQWSY